MLPWMYVHFPRLQLDALEFEYRQLQPQDAQQPCCPEALIVVNTKQNRVCQLNRAAKAQGIKLDMGLATAVSLCGELNIHQYNPQLAQNRLNELAQWLYQAVADIVLFEPDGLALKVSNMMSLYGSIDNYWHKVSELLQQHQVHYQVAMGKTVSAARLLARSAQYPLLQDEAIVQQKLEQLPVGKLELPARQIEQMQRVGITRLKQLWDIDTKALGRRFGLEVLNYLSALKGFRQVPLQVYQPPEQYRQYLELFHEIAQSQILLFPLQRMLKQMSGFLQKRDLEVTEVFITLHHRDKDRNPNTEIAVGSAGGEYRADKWMALIGLKIERTELIAPVVGLSIHTGEMVEKNAADGQLFNDSNAQMTPTQLVSLLQAKVGKSHIVGLELFADHRPEFAFGYANPLTPMALPQDTPLPSLRPLLLLPQAVPVKEKHHVLHGPERLRSAWWSKDAVYRDYYVTRSADGAICWLYHQPDGRWFLQGYFC